jgi:hypothetical protein
LRKTTFLLALLLLPAAALFADEVFLKGAGSISGRIVEQNATTVMVDIGGGVMGVPMSHVDHIVKARSPLDDYDDRAAKLTPQDVNGWRELARWASGQGLTKQSHQAYEKVLAIAPNDKEAKEAMGFVMVDGRWMTEEESYRARGYVNLGGEWMTPSEAQMRDAQAAAEQSRLDAERSARQAETEKMLSENRAATAAAKAAEQAARDRDESSWSQPVYWGGWGYGVSTWPTPPVVNGPGYQVPR